MRNRIGNSGTGLSCGSGVGVSATFNRFTNLTNGIVFFGAGDGTYHGNLMIHVTTPYTGGTAVRP
jgi:hypothetical protein